MPPDTAERRPRAGGGAHDDGHDVRASVQPGPVTGCPCGCMTRLPWIDDPDCARHRPAPGAREWPSYDVTSLGLVPHDRARCPECLAVGA